MTRTPLFAFILISILLTCSCSKSNNDTPTPTPPVDTTTLVKPDTLTAGWSKIKIDTASLYDVFFSNNTVGYSITGNGRLYKSIDGGLTWNLKNNVGQVINMSVTNNGNIHIVGGFVPSVIYSSVNGGTSFSTTPLNVGNNAFDVFFPDDNNGFTVCAGVLLQTTDGGINWAGVAPTTGLSLSITGANSLFFLNDSTGWICGDGKIFKTNGNLHSWTQSAFTGVPSLNYIVNVYPISGSSVYAINYRNFFKSVDGGNNFSLIHSFPYLGNAASSIVPDIHFIDANTGYVNWGNRIYKTTNGGTSWTPVVSLGGSSYIVEIHFTDANHGWGCTTEIGRAHV